MKNAIITIKKITFFLSVISILTINLGCEKEKSATTVYEWSATIDGVNYSYSTSTPNQPDGGFAHANSPGNGLHTILLKARAGVPTFSIILPSFNVGTYTINSNSNSSYSFILEHLRTTAFYLTDLPSSQITINITRTGTAGGTLEGTFSGKANTSTIVNPGLPSSVNITNGTFKTYIQN